MKKILLLTFVLLLSKGYSQTDRLWARANSENITKANTVERPSFPTDFQLFQLNFNSMKQILANAQDRFSGKKAVLITLPNADGELEQFEVFEASNFAPELQAQFPEIRAYVGTSLSDSYGLLRMSISPQGISTMVFRTDKNTEFMEPYSEDGKIYALYNSSRNKGSLPFTCSTEDNAMALSINNNTKLNRSSNSELLTFRLALSCTGEYGVSAGGTVAGALARMNTTMTRVNGVFEKDLTIHMNIIANNTAIIFTNATTDPYSPGAAGSAGAWNAEVQSTITSLIGEANYDIGHLFGATGGGGNAGCIGCICIDNIKGRGYTSPGSGAPTGDNFDIDYVAHEMGHQLGGNHTFSHNIEGSGVNVEPGSGSTIMGYAGITSYDVQLHSDAYFHWASINQIEQNMAFKTCPVRTPISNVAPVVDAGIDYTIPKSTPFVLTGTGTDPNGNTLTYCWEQTDTATSESDAASAASATKAGGPNWRSYNPTASPSRYFPPLTRVIANQSTTTGSAIVTEALSSIARPLRFSFTGRDNVLGNGLTDTDNMIVNVNGTAGPFLVSSPNTAVSWVVGTNQTVTWAVAGTTANGVNAAYVDIYLSTNGGTTASILLASKVPNDGSEVITVPNNVGTSNRVIIRGYKHIFYDMSNANFAITAATSSFSVAFNRLGEEQNKGVCQGNSVSYTIEYAAYSGFSGSTSFSVTGLPGGAVATFSPPTISANGNVTMTISNTNGSAVGFYSLLVSATSGATTKTVPFYLQLFNASFPSMTLISPSNLATGLTSNLNLTWAANSNANSYDVEVATDVAFTNIVRSINVTSTTYAVSGLNLGTEYYWRVLPKNTGCNGSYSTVNKFTTGQIICDNYVSTNVPIVISSSGTSSVSSTIQVNPGASSVTDVSVSLDLTHSNISDLTITLINPFGNQVALVANPCTAGVQNINATFDDSASAFTCGSNPGISGTVRGIQDLSSYNGDPSTGTWTLQIDDSANGNGGTLNSWNVTICSFQAIPLSVNSNQFQDFALYPNPNKGNFTVQFTSVSNNDVAISVHDMRGRIIYDKKYNNTGLFSQNLQLDNAQAGVYLVTVQSGDQRIVKRVIIE